MSDKPTIHIPELINIKGNLSAATEEGTVYIGRGIHGLTESPLANPYKIAKDTSGDRLDAIALYRDHIMANPVLRRTVGDLKKAERLACWCSPKLCHGLVLQEILGVLEKHGTKCPSCEHGDIWGQPKYARNEKHAIYESWMCSVCRWRGFGAPNRAADREYLAQQGTLL